MRLSQEIQRAIDGSSWIRRMFEQGLLLMQEHGRDQVFDLSIGNPTFEPPAAVKEAWLGLLRSGERGLHRYMSNAGLPETREYVAASLKRETGLPFTANEIVMCAGAAGGLNVVLKSLCDPGSEVVILKPFFAEYLQYIANYQGRAVTVDTRPDFQLDLGAIEAALTPRTRAVLINSPNNPTGVVYPKEELTRLGELLRRKSRELGSPIALVADEPYRRIVYDGVKVPWVFECYENTLSVTSFSKDLAIPGERIGYVAVSPSCENKEALEAGLVIANRILGFVNAPALMQRMIPLAAEALVDMTVYQRNRDLLHGELTRLGFECARPQGTFYLFPRSPVPDDREFVQKALEYRLLLVPGVGFGRPGYFRISYCFETQLIERALPVFAKLARDFGLS